MTDLKLTSGLKTTRWCDMNMELISPKGCTKHNEIYGYMVADRKINLITESYYVIEGIS